MAFVLVPGIFPGFFRPSVLLGSDENDVIFLNSGEASNAEVLLLSGNDRLQSPNINDLLIVNGNLGSDTISGGLNNDSLFGGRDGDRLFGSDGRDQLFGNIGPDTIEGGVGDDSIFGGQDDDILNGDQGDDTIFGDRGDDILDGDAGRDDLIGGDGEDIFVFDPGEASSNVEDVDWIIQGFDAGNSAGVGDKIAVPRGLLNQIEIATLRRNFDVNGDQLDDIAIELIDGRFLGVLIDDGTLPNELDLDIDFIEDNGFDFNL